MNKKSSRLSVCVIGLGYVGLPLLIEFSRKYSAVGYDKSQTRIKDLSNGLDITNEINKKELRASSALLTNKLEDIKNHDFYIITVPTPLTDSMLPDLSMLKAASELVGKSMSKGATVIYESTVYPGVTEDVCLPILQRKSGLKLNTDFFLGYSPERINPGDKERTITKITKVVSGSSNTALNRINLLYSSIIDAGTFKASSIKVAEAAKVIENTQRDLNIALINELHQIFSKLKIDTNDVLSAAATKWNFLEFKPGLVGGHCIGIDPYYLTYKSKKVGIRPKVILSGRETNEKMSSYYANKIINEIAISFPKAKEPKILLCGITFKQNCNDVRNTKVVDLYRSLIREYKHIDIFDPIADKKALLKDYGINLINEAFKRKYDYIILAVPHDKFKNRNFLSLKKFSKDKTIWLDLKNFLPKSFNSIHV